MGLDDDTIYESTRRFEVWTWGVGHRGLLLRSNPAAGAPTRIELWFKPAYAVSLPSWLDDIQISRTSDSARKRATEVLGRTLADYEDLFVVRSRQGFGWVVAGGVHGREDDNEYDAPTMFDGWEAGPDVRTLFSSARG